MRPHWTFTILLPVAVLASAGCATRDWVRELVGKKDAEIDQRFVGVEKRVAEDAERIEGLGSRLQTVETSLTQTGQLARSAQTQAEEAASRVTRHSRHLYHREIAEAHLERFDQGPGRHR